MNEGSSDAEDEDYDCMVCGVVSESDMTQDDQLCDPCLKTHESMWSLSRF